MKRSPLKPSTKPMERTPFKRNAPMPSTGVFSVHVHQRQAPARKAAMKSRGPRMTPTQRAAQGQDCTLQLAGVCNRNPETTVLCHSPYLKDGRGMGLKSPDDVVDAGRARRV